MIFTEEQAIALIKNNQQVSKSFQSYRDESKELTALIEGDNFHDVLIHRIEKLEKEDLFKSRKKYSREVKDFSQRIDQPISAVFNATGGSVSIENISDSIKKQIDSKRSNVRNNISLRKWIESFARPISHIDPNGVFFMEFLRNQDNSIEDVYPTYKSIGSIRAYELKGNLLEYILFEPKEIVLNGQASRLWRFVDDEADRTFQEIGGEYVLLEDDNLTFNHPFGVVPAITCSIIQKTNDTERKISPIWNIVPLFKEYAGDTSKKNIYKNQHFFPVNWRYQTKCNMCHGTGKTGAQTCSSCNGKGYLVGKFDVTTEIIAEMPKDGMSAVAKFTGFETPDIAFIDKANEELKGIEELTFRTLWGTLVGMTENINGVRTATEIVSNRQPMENRLNFYSDYAETIETYITIWIAKFFDESNNDINVSINYGRNYITEPPELILKVYQESKEKGDNSIVLDRLFSEYITAKYINNPNQLREELTRSRIEPHLHLGFEMVIDVFGIEEAQKKALFSKWWQTVDLKLQTDDQLTSEFNTWFTSNNLNINTNERTSGTAEEDGRV